MISEVMTRDVRFVAPRESLQRAAQMMDELNVGALPVCDGERLVGMITDRDITVRATSAGKAPGATCVEDAMSADVRWCFEDQPLDEVMQQMGDSQIRRVPVVTHDEAHKLVGIVSLGDLATKTADSMAREDVEQVVERVSSPSEPDRSPSRSASQGSASAVEMAGDRGKGSAAGAGPAGSGAGPTTASTAIGAGERGKAGETSGRGPAGAGVGGSASVGIPAGGTVGGPGSTSAPARGIADAGGGVSSPPDLTAVSRRVADDMAGNTGDSGAPKRGDDERKK